MSVLSNKTANRNANWLIILVNICVEVTRTSQKVLSRPRFATGTVFVTIIIQVNCLNYFYTIMVSVQASNGTICSTGKATNFSLSL